MCFSMCWKRRFPNSKILNVYKRPKPGLNCSFICNKNNNLKLDVHMTPTLICIVRFSKFSLPTTYYYLYCLLSFRSQNVPGELDDELHKECLGKWFWCQSWHGNNHHCSINISTIVRKKNVQEKFLATFHIVF